MCLSRKIIVCYCHLSHHSHLSFTSISVKTHSFPVFSSHHHVHGVKISTQWWKPARTNHISMPLLSLPGWTEAPKDGCAFILQSLSDLSLPGLHWDQRPGKTNSGGGLCYTFSPFSQLNFKPLRCLNSSFTGFWVAMWPAAVVQSQFSTLYAHPSNARLPSIWFLALWYVRFPYRLHLLWWQFWS